jgi:hypothetical protein
MSERVECSVCGDPFDDERALRQHKEAKHPEAVRSKNWTEFLKGIGRYTVYGLGALGAAFVIAYWVIPYFGQQSMKQELPGQGDHWHARYSISICGEQIPPRPYSQGDVHTHGKDKIHVHPHSSATAGKGANLGAFFESFDGTLTDSKIAIPMVGTYENGDKCNGDPGEVVVNVNGNKISDPANYVPQDGDVIHIRFEAGS